MIFIKLIRKIFDRLSNKPYNELLIYASSASMTRSILSYLLRRHSQYLGDTIAFGPVTDFHLVIFLRYFFAVVASIYIAAVFYKAYLKDKT